MANLRRTKNYTRRSFIRDSIQAICAVNLLSHSQNARACDDTPLGPLETPDTNGLMLPRNFSSRIVAVSNQTVSNSSYIWHQNPDGGATFAVNDGGWIYVSNSETNAHAGGVGAIRFDALGNIIDAYPILRGTTRNCAGGSTPWGTWLSCEEIIDGLVFECDPFKPYSQGEPRPACGTFMHEAAAVDPFSKSIYLTEDLRDGRLYKFTPTRFGDLSSGQLQSLEILDPDNLGPIIPGEVRPIAWHVISEPNPSFTETPTRYQAPLSTPFNGGEGCGCDNGLIYFSTKGDNRIWMIDTVYQTIEILYDNATAASWKINPDNLLVTACGDIYVAEDPGQLRVLLIDKFGVITPFAQLTGVSGTEITGPALSPDCRRLYFSSQRNPGVTYEVSAPPNQMLCFPVPEPKSAVLQSTAVLTLAFLAIRSRRSEEESEH